MKQKEIDFDPENLVASVEALARHASSKKKLAMRTARLKNTEPVSFRNFAAKQN